MHARRIVTSLASTLALAALATGQTQLHETKGSTWYEELGTALAPAGDVDADGVEDWIAGAPIPNESTALPGRAVVYSGATFAPLHTLTGTLPGGDFGYAVAGAGDLDGDGHDDLLVGAPDFVPGSPHFTGTTAGSVSAFSGATGALLFTLSGDVVGDEFGYSVDSLDDVDGDGVRDLVVGAPRSAAGGLQAGLVRAYSGATRAPLWEFVGPAQLYIVGDTLAGVGDVDGDGIEDVLAGAPGNNPKGLATPTVFLLSGADGAVLHTLALGTASEAFGQTVGAAGDLNGDGTPDLLVGAPGSNAFEPSAGSLYAFSGADWSELWRVDGRASLSELGFSVAAIGDVDGDGASELAVGAVTDTAQGFLYSGYVAVLDGATGVEIGRAYGEDLMRLGWAVAGVGDLDGDGRLELLAGGLDGNANAVGIVRHYEVDAPMPPSTYCTPKLSSQGCLPRISSSGSPTASGADDFVLRADQVINQKLGMAIWSTAPGFHWSYGGTLCLSGAVHRTTLVSSGGNTGGDDCSGTLAFPFTQALMAQQGLAPGTLVHAQFWFRDPALPYNKIGFSDGLAFFVAP